MTQSGWISLAVVLACAGWLAWRGYERGVIRTLQRVVSMIGAYGACYLGLVPLASWIQAALSWQLITAYLASGVLCFFGAAFVVEMIMKALADHVENRGIEPAKIPGALLGLSMGALLGLVLVWIGGILYDAYRVQKQPTVHLGAGVDPIRDWVGSLAGEAVGSAVDHAMVNQGGSESLLPAMASQLASNPVQLSQQVMQLSQSEAMRNIFNDPYAQHFMLTQQIDALQETPVFQQLMMVPQATEMLALLGGVQKDAVSNSTHASGDAHQKAARTLTDMYRRIYRIQNDPRFLTLSQKPEFKQLSQNPSPLAMMSNPAFSELSEIILNPVDDEALDGQALGGGASISEANSSDPSEFRNLAPLEWETLKTDEQVSEAETDDDAVEMAPVTQAGKLMYRWTDENGRKNYSENKPEGVQDVEVIRVQE